MQTKIDVGCKSKITNKKEWFEIKMITSETKPVDTMSDTTKTR